LKYNTLANTSINTRMKTIRFFFLFFLLLVVNANAINFSDVYTDWELAKEKNGIKVYTRQAEGRKIKEFKAIMTVNSTLEEIEKVIDHVNEYASWQANVTTSKSLLEEGNTEQYIYYTSELPWPVDDRDIVLHSIKSKHENNLIYELTSSPDYIERNDDFLRIINSKGSWIFVANNEGQVDVTYQFYGDPGRNMPNWLINLFIVDGPHETMINLKNKVE